MTDKEPHEQFHDHLDECRTCRENPFGLCPIGVRLLREGAEFLGIGLRSLDLREKK